MIGWGVIATVETPRAGPIVEGRLPPCFRSDNSSHAIVYADPLRCRRALAQTYIPLLLRLLRGAKRTNFGSAHSTYPAVTHFHHPGTEQVLTDVYPVRPKTSVRRGSDFEH